MEAYLHSTFASVALHSHATFNFFLIKLILQDTYKHKVAHFIFYIAILMKANWHCIFSYHIHFMMFLSTAKDIHFHYF